MRIIPDTNVLVSAFVFKSEIANNVVRYAVKKHTLLFSESSVKELKSTCRDPKDNKFLELAVAGNADCIVTGDKDLLVLNSFRNIQIITPKEFLEQC